MVAAAGCGADAAPTHGHDAHPAKAATTVKVAGQVSRSCVGPMLAGRPPRCYDRAVFARQGRRVTVKGKFSIRLHPGRYRVSVDTCTDQQTLNLKRAISRLKLVPHCAVPL